MHRHEKGYMRRRYVGCWTRRATESKGLRRERTATGQDWAGEGGRGCAHCRPNCWALALAGREGTPRRRQIIRAPNCWALPRGSIDASAASIIAARRRPSISTSTLYHHPVPASDDRLPVCPPPTILVASRPASFTPLFQHVPFHTSILGLSDILAAL